MASINVKAPFDRARFDALRKALVQEKLVEAEGDVQFEQEQPDGFSFSAPTTVPTLESLAAMTARYFIGHEVEALGYTCKHNPGSPIAQGELFAVRLKRHLDRGFSSTVHALAHRRG